MQEAITPRSRVSAEARAPARLLAVLAALRGEVEGVPAAETALASPIAEKELLAALRSGLLALARPSVEPGPDIEPAALRGALQGMEYVVRGDLLAGRAAELPQRLPSFVFLALLPTVGREEALGVAGQAAGLLGDAG